MSQQKKFIFTIIFIEAVITALLGLVTLNFWAHFTLITFIYLVLILIPVNGSIALITVILFNAVRTRRLLEDLQKIKNRKETRDFIEMMKEDTGRYLN